MKRLGKNIVRIFIVIYFAIAAGLVVAEALYNQKVIVVLKPLLLPLLAIIYLISSKARSKLYLLCLLFGLLSNIALISTDPMPLVYGAILFMFGRIIMIILVWRSTEKFHPFAFGIAVLPFLFFFTYLIDMTEEDLSANFYPAIANSILMTILAALSLSKYIFEDNRKNSWLLISSLLFVLLMFIFVIQRYYVDNPVFQPMAVVVFTVAHFGFYKFILLEESDDESVGV